MEKDSDRPASDRQRLCLECLECCRSLTFSVPMHPMLGERTREVLEIYRSFYGVRGCRSAAELDYMGVRGRHFLHVSVPLPCQYLTESGCAVYSQRPRICRLYDGRKDPMVRARCKWRGFD